MSWKTMSATAKIMTSYHRPPNSDSSPMKTAFTTQQDSKRNGMNWWSVNSNNTDCAPTSMKLRWLMCLSSSTEPHAQPLKKTVPTRYSWLWAYSNGMRPTGASSRDMRPS